MYDFIIFFFHRLFFFYVIDIKNNCLNIEREIMVKALWSKVKKNGLFILIEPGSPKGYRFVNDFRNWIIKKDRAQASILAPCPHH